MKKLFYVTITFLFWPLFQVTAQNKYSTHFEKSKGTETPTYQNILNFYAELAETSDAIQLKEMGLTDSGIPLHIAIYNPDMNFNFAKIRKQKRVVLIINGIHPGESDGIDATMLLYRDLVEKKITIPKETVIITIPVYNIGGALNRNSTSRTNQNGPKTYGFRGNARNYDLNRDFIKNDTKNARAFAEIFHLVQPDVCIDTHVSNGADYQYTLTHLFTQHNALGGQLGKLLHHEIRPDLEQRLANKNWDITPYVNVWGTTPDKGWAQFMDTPRYSTGYTTLWNTLGLMIETHMLKPYKQRVLGTYELLKTMIEITESRGKDIRKVRQLSFNALQQQAVYTTNWIVDTTTSRELLFKGYEGTEIISEVTGLPRLKYNQLKPYEKEVNYQDTFMPTLAVTIPEAYIIPQGWWKVIDRLRWNRIKFNRLTKDTTITVQSYRIKDYKTRSQPYEGHYLHYDTTLEKQTETRLFRKGDYVVTTHQDGIRYLLETLEPEAVDSFFNWNFFDTILQQKEGFSAYVWEDKAMELLEKKPALKKAFIEKRSDTVFKNNAYKQLDWIHKQSVYYEKAHLQYPVYRIEKK